MGFYWDLQNRLKQSGYGLFCLFLFIYFGYHAVNGDRGFLKMLYLKKEIADTAQIAQSYHQEKIRLEEKVRLLSGKSLDLDMLEERARVVLNLSGADEFVILDE